MTQLYLQCGRLRTVLLRAFALFFLQCCAFHAFAQEDFKPKFGVIDRPSLDMTAYAGDSTADAVRLYDYANVKFFYDPLKGFVMQTDFWVRIKILKESALDWASVGLTYYSGSSYKDQEWIDDLKGITYNLENGKVVTNELDKKSIKREKSSDKLFTTKFNLPNVKKGSVIEYSYSMLSPMSVRNTPDMWTFQGSIPFKWSEYRIAIPYFLNYKMTFGGYLPLHINKQDKENVVMGHSKFDGPGMSYRFVVKDAPAFVDEPYITTSKDYLSRIKFELASIDIPGEMTKQFSQTWENVERTLEESSWFGGELRRSSFLKEAKEEIAKKSTDPQERMNLAYTYIQKCMKWNGYNGLGGSDGARKAYENKKGSACDINLMLTVLLRELDLDCNPVLISTRGHGHVFQEIPMLESFNYVIAHVKIGEQEYMLDATQTYAKPGLLPEHALNGYGRIIPRKGQGRFIEIVPRDLQSKLEMVNATISPADGTIKGNYGISYGGYEALRWREKYSGDKQNTFNDDLKGLVPEWQLKNIAITDKLEDLKSSVSVSCDFEVEDENASPGIFYFNPMMAGRWARNPLKSKERIYPLDLGAGISNSYIGNFTLPEGYVLEEMPKSEMITLPDKAGKFTYQVRQTGNIIQINSVVQISKVRFDAEEYHDLKEFFERVVQKHAQPLVVKKQVN